MSWRKLLYRLGLLLGLALFGYQLWQAVRALLEHPGAIIAPGYLVAAVAVDVLAYLCLILGWTLLMRASGVRLAATQAGQGYMLSFLPRYVPGTVWGYLSRSEWLAQSAGVSYRRSGVASAMEVGFQVLTAAFFGTLLINSPFLRIAGGAISIGMGIAAWRMMPRVLNRADQGANDTTPISLPWRYFFAVLTIYSAFWYLHGLSTWLVAISIGAASSLNSLTATPVFATSWLVGFLVILVPSGLGVREWTLNYLLVANAGMSPDAAAFVSVVVRLAIIVAELLLLLWAASRSMSWLQRPGSEEDKRHAS